LTTYEVYGRALASELPLPELAECDGPADVSFRVASLPQAEGDWFDVWPTEHGTPWVRARRTPAGYRLRYELRAEFQVDRVERTIVCDPFDCPAPMLRHFLLDQVIPLALSLDSVVLHASSVAIDEGFAAFIGPGGAGKSTVAIALARSGYAIGSDDGLLIRVGDSVEAAPSYPSVRLWEDSAAAVAGRPALNVDAPPTAKRQYRDGFRFVRGERPLARICLLDREPAATLRFEPLSPRDAAMALVEQSYRLALEDRARLARQLDDLTRIARSVPACRLHWPRQLESWRDLSRAIGAHLGGTPAVEVA